MWKVDKFLCFKLETGGRLIGWLTLLSNLSYILSAYGSLQKVATDDSSKAKSGIEFEKIELLVAIKILIFIRAIYEIIGSIIFILGVNYRNPSLVYTYFVMEIISTIIIVPALSLLPTDNLLMCGFLYGILFIYYLVVIHSLYEKLKAELRGDFIDALIDHLLAQSIHTQTQAPNNQANNNPCDDAPPPYSDVA